MILRLQEPVRATYLDQPLNTPEPHSAGTVWGIMNSFRSLANMSQATLASVAPGISEALIATAMGLFAAIPAVIAYNRYSAKMDLLSDRYEDFSEEVIAILHRAAHSRDLKD